MEDRYDTSSTSGTSTGAAGAGEQVMNKTQAVLQQGKEQAGKVAEQVKDQVKTGISSKKDEAAGQLGAVAEALRQTGQSLQGQERGAVGDYAVRAAEVVDGISEALRSKDIDQMVADVEHFARRNPAVFLGSAFVLGFMAARFLKSSSQPRYESRDRYSSNYGYEGDARYSNSYGESRYGTSGHSGRELRTAYDAATQVEVDDLPPAVTASGRVRADQYPHLSPPSTSTVAGTTETDDEFDSEGIATNSRGE